jgi:multidrug efflux pump subunit AcrB
VSRPAIALLVTLSACRGTADPPAPTRAPTVPGIVTVAARTQRVTDTVRAFGAVVADGERPEVRDARTQLTEADARAQLAAEQTARLQALTRGGVAPQRSWRSRRVLATRDGVSVPVDAVADVADGPAVAVGDAVIDGEPGVALLVTKQPNVNVLEVTRDVERALAAIARALPAGVRLDRDLFRQASFVEHATANLRRALVVAASFVGLVLLLFLGDLRAVAVSLVAIPLSLLSAVLVLRAFGATLNVMVLGGLAIAVGEVVDDAIIDLENVWRHLRLAPPGTPADDVVLAASIEVRSAVVYATAMVEFVSSRWWCWAGSKAPSFARSRWHTCWPRWPPWAWRSP